MGSHPCDLINPNHVPKPHPQIPSPWGLELQHINFGDTNIQSIAVNTRGKGLLKGEVLMVFRNKWEMSSQKARLDVGFGDHRPGRKIGTVRVQGPGKEGCGEDSGETR